MASCCVMLFFAACLLPFLTDTIATHHEEREMKVLNKVELSGILSRIAQPFTLLKNKRNLHLDQLFDGLQLKLLTFGTEDMKELYEVLLRATGRLPDYQNTMLPAFRLSVEQLNFTFAYIDEVFQRCESKPVTFGVKPSLDALFTSQVRSVGLDNSSDDAVVKEEEEKEEEVIEEEEGGKDMKDESKLPARIVPLASALTDELKRPLTCDEECQTIAIGSNLGTHVAVEDLAAVFSDILGMAIHQHRLRYQRYLQKIKDVQSKLGRFSDEFHILKDQARGFKHVIKDVQREAVRLLQAFTFGTDLLLMTLGRVTC